MKTFSTFWLVFLVASQSAFAIQTQEVDLGRSGVYDGLVKITRDNLGRMTLCDTEVTSPITLNDLRFHGSAHWLLQGLDRDDHPHYHNDERALAWLGARSTSDLPEGDRLYYTDVRARAALSAAPPLLYNSTTGAFGLDSTASPTFAGLALTGLPSTAIPYATAGGALAGNTSRFCILSDGKVGIGTASPVSLLEVRSQTAAAPTLSLGSTLASIPSQTITGSIQLGYLYSGNNTWYHQAAINGVNENGGDSSYGALTLMTRSAGVTAERVRVTSAGNVGIGTATPTAKLDVNGGGRIRGALLVDAETTLSAVNIAGRARLASSPAQLLTTDSQTIACNSALVVLDATGNRLMSSTPTIAAGVEGQVITIVNQNAGYYIDFSDAASSPGSNLALGSTTRTLHRRDVLTMIYTGGMWCEMLYSQNH